MMMRKITCPEYIWKEMEYDTPEQIFGKEYPKTIFYLQWQKMYCHIIETEDGKFFCGYTNQTTLAQTIYQCDRAFIDDLVGRLEPIGVFLMLNRFENDPAFLYATRSLFAFWAIECHWNSVNFRFLDDVNCFTYDFVCQAMRIMQVVEEAIASGQGLTPFKKRKFDLVDLLKSFFK